MSKMVLIGTVEISEDVVMYNRSFQYAGSFEDILVKKGIYEIMADSTDLDRYDDNRDVRLGWRNYIVYKGTVVASNVGGKQGDETKYCQHSYAYMLAEDFLKGHKYIGSAKYTYRLRPEWGITVSDSVYDGERIFSLGIYLKGEITYAE